MIYSARTLIRPLISGNDILPLPQSANFRMSFGGIRNGVFELIANGSVTTAASVTFAFTLPQNSSWVCFWAARCAQNHNGRLRVLGGTTVATHALTSSWQHFADAFTYSNSANNFQLEMQNGSVAENDQTDFAYCHLIRTA